MSWFWILCWMLAALSGVARVIEVILMFRKRARRKRRWEAKRARW